MHIAIDARIINSSTGRYVERLLTHLQDIDKVNDYSIIVPSKDKSYWVPKNKNFKIITSDADNYSFSEQTDLKKLLDSLDPDLVHFCMPQQPVLYKGKKVTTFHDLTLVKTYNSDKNWLIFHAKQLVGKSVFKKVAKSNNHIIVPSKFTEKELIAFTGISKKKISLTYLASDVSGAGSKPYPVPFKKYIMYVGQQADFKNIKRLGDAHQELLKTDPDLGLVLVGRKNAAALINEDYFIKKSYKNILFTDFVPDNQMNWLFTHASAYVFPSLMEGFGLPGLEAMGHGTPVVSSNATCLPEVYGEAAHYFDPYDTNDMVRAISEVLTDEKLRAKLSKNGYEQIKKYSWKKMAEQTHAVYMDVLKTKS